MKGYPSNLPGTMYERGPRYCTPISLACGGRCRHTSSFEQALFLFVQNHEIGVFRCVHSGVFLKSYIIAFSNLDGL